MEALVVIGVKTSQDVASRGGPLPRAYLKHLRSDSFKYPASSQIGGEQSLTAGTWFLTRAIALAKYIG